MHPTVTEGCKALDAATRRSDARSAPGGIAGAVALEAEAEAEPDAGCAPVIVPAGDDAALLAGALASDADVVVTRTGCGCAEPVPRSRLRLPAGTLVT